MTRFNTITVAELIERLQEEDPEAMVVFSSNYGDIAKTQQAHPISGIIQEQMVVPSVYSDSGFALSTDDEDDEDDECPVVLVIS